MIAMQDMWVSVMYDVQGDAMHNMWLNFMHDTLVTVMHEILVKYMHSRLVMECMTFQWLPYMTYYTGGIGKYPPGAILKTL